MRGSKNFWGGAPGWAGLSILWLFLRVNDLFGRSSRTKPRVVEYATNRWASAKFTLRVLRKNIGFVQRRQMLIYFCLMSSFSALSWPAAVRRYKILTAESIDDTVLLSYITNTVETQGHTQLRHFYCGRFRSLHSMGKAWWGAGWWPQIRFLNRVFATNEIVKLSK